MTPYYADDAVTLYLGDCREITEWLTADVLVTDPPYGRAWKARSGWKNAHGEGGHRSTGQAVQIANDTDATTRDAALAAWGFRPAVVFGDPLIASPEGAVQALGISVVPRSAWRSVRSTASKSCADWSRPPSTSAVPHDHGPRLARTSSRASPPRSSSGSWA